MIKPLAKRTDFRETEQRISMMPAPLTTTSLIPHPPLASAPTISRFLHA